MVSVLDFHADYNCLSLDFLFHKPVMERVFASSAESAGKRRQATKIIQFSTKKLKSSY